MACHSNVNNVRNSSTEISTMKANFKEISLHFHLLQYQISSCLMNMFNRQ